MLGQAFAAGGCGTVVRNTTQAKSGSRHQRCRRAFQSVQGRHCTVPGGGIRVRIRQQGTTIMYVIEEIHARANENASEWFRSCEILGLSQRYGKSKRN